MNFSQLESSAKDLENSNEEKDKLIKTLQSSIQENEQMIETYRNTPDHTDIESKFEAKIHELNEKLKVYYIIYI